MNRFFIFLLGILAISLAATTAFFSVYGISKLFIGQALAVIILFGTLEVVKIVFVSVYHQFSKRLSWLYKTVLVGFIVVLMAVTSIGVYGFLTSAYSSTSVDLEKLSGQTEIFDKKIEIKEGEKQRVIDQIEMKNTRVTTLGELRKSQETRLDSLYQKGWYKSAKQTEQIIRDANNDINRLTKGVDSLNMEIQIINDSISSYSIQKLELNSGKLSGEIGPLKYIASITELPMDHVVNWLMLIFVFLADPGAVLLVVLTNKIIKMNRDDRKAKKKALDEVPVIEEDYHLESPDESLRKSQAVDFSDTNKLLDEVEKVISEDSEKENKKEDSEFPKVVMPTKEEAETIEDEKKKIVEYVADQAGEFVKVKKQIIDAGNGLIVPGIFTAQTSSVETRTIKNEDRSEYTTLLTYFYRNGDAVKGEEIPTFPEFKKILEDVKIIVNEKTLQDFLLICGLLKITEFNNKKGVYNKEFEEAKSLMSEI